MCGLLNECSVICCWCLSFHHFNFFPGCHFVWKLFPGKACLTIAFCFCSSVQKNTQYILVFDAFVIVICLASLILCTRSIVLALKLRKVRVCSSVPPPLLASILSFSKQWTPDWSSCPFWSPWLNAFERWPSCEALVTLRCGGEWRLPHDRQDQRITLLKPS